MDSGLNKKIYRELIVIVIISILTGAAISWVIYGILSISSSTYIYVISGLSAAFLIIMLVDTINRKKIVLYVHNIYVPWGAINKRSSQMEVDIKYVDIRKISCEDSLGDGGTTTNWLLRQYIRTRVVLETENGEQHRICISWYTKKTQERILDDIIARCSAVGNKLDVPCGKELLANRKK